MQHVPDFSIGKAEVFIIFHISDGQHTEVVESRKNTLPRNSKTSGQHRKMEAAVALQYTAEKIADQPHHFIVITGVLRLVQRDIIFINQEYGFLAIMFV